MPQPPPLVLEPILPEIILTGMAIVVLLLDAFTPSRNQRLSALLSLGADGAAGLRLDLAPPG